MDHSSAAKKRKADENGDGAPYPSVTLEDAQKIISTFTQEQLQSIVATAMLQYPSVLDAVRAIADEDTTLRKLFIRGLGWETTNDALRQLFSAYGELKEAVIICDKATGKSKGYGFITFKHIDGAMLALKEPSKKIDGRVTVTQLASPGNVGAGAAAAAGAAAPMVTAAPPQDVASRKIYVGAVPSELPPDRLLQLFSSFGEIEEGPLGFDKQTGKLRGYALFVYKTVEAARAAVQEPTKIVDGHQLVCRFANDGKKKQGMAENKPVAVSENKVGDGTGGGFGPQSSMPGSFSSQYGVPGSGLSSYGFGAGMGNHHSPLQSSIGSGPAGQVPPSMGSMGGSGGGVFGSGGGFGGPYGSASQFSGGPGLGGYGGMGMGMGMGSSMYNRMQPSSGGTGSGGFSDAGPYSMSSIGHSGQHHQSAISPSGPGRMPPPGGMYQSMPPYY